MKRLVSFAGLLLFAVGFASAADNEAPEGFTALFNGRDFAGWHGLGTFDIRKLDEMTDEERREFLDKEDASMKTHWTVDNGELVNDGQGAYMTTDKNYGDFELYVSWKLIAKGDSGVYLKGTPQIQIWDFTEKEYFKMGADRGSGGLWNNAAGTPGKDPRVRADKPIGEWNTFRVIQCGARTTVYLNGRLVINQAPLQNYFDKSAPLFPKGPVQLQTHGNEVRWKNIYIRELSADEANDFLASRCEEEFQPIFNGKDLEGWKGPVDDYEVADGSLRCKPGKGGMLHTVAEYGDFVARLEFKLPEAGNNGVLIRYPGEGNGAYTAMCELQVLDNEHPMYAKLDKRQYHGSAYGMVPAHRGYLRPTGEWNFQEITVKGPTIKVELNGSQILDADLSTVTELMDNTPHPGKDRTSGHFGFAGHGDAVEFRNVAIRELK
jgi:hypothetical protein